MYWLFAIVISVRRKLLCQGKKKVQQVMKKVQPQLGVREKNLMIEGRKSCRKAELINIIIKKTIGYVRNGN